MTCTVSLTLITIAKTDSSLAGLVTSYSGLIPSKIENVEWGVLRIDDSYLFCINRVLHVVTCLVTVYIAN